MTAPNLANLIIGVIALVYILPGQLRARLATTDMRLPMILAAIGLIQLTQFLHRGSHGTEMIAALAGSLVLAAASGAIRAATVHVWLDDGRSWRKGNWLTALLWVVSLTIHLGYDYVADGRGPNAGLGAATLLLYLAVTDTVQRLVVQARARRIAAAQHLDPGTHITVGWP